MARQAVTAKADAARLAAHAAICAKADAARDAVKRADTAHRVRVHICLILAGGCLAVIATYLGGMAAHIGIAFPVLPSSLELLFDKIARGD
jgi:hypothetical protein